MSTGTGLPLMTAIPSGPPMGMGPSGAEMTASMGAIDENIGTISAAQKMSERMRLDERELFVTAAIRVATNSGKCGKTWGIANHWEFIALN